MKTIRSHGVLALMVATILAVSPAHAQLEDLFGDPDKPSAASQDVPALERKASESKRQAQNAPLRQAAVPAQQAPTVAKADAERIVIYTTPTCPHCRRALKHMQSKGIAFEQKDVQHNQANRAEFQRLGGRGVPHILMGDAVLMGFDPKDFDRQYTAWKAEPGRAR